MTIYITWLIIVALVGLIAGFIGGIFFGAHLTRTHFLHMNMMQQRYTAPQPQPRTKHLRRDEGYY